MHALGGEHAPLLKLPVLVLLQQHRDHQSLDRSIVREDAEPAGAPLDHCAAKRTSLCDIEALEQVGASDLLPALGGEVAESQDVLAGFPPSA